jgi:hypothetical protein
VLHPMVKGCSAWLSHRGSPTALRRRCDASPRGLAGSLGGSRQEQTLLGCRNPLRRRLAGVAGQSAWCVRRLSALSRGSRSATAGLAHLKHRPGHSSHPLESRRRTGLLSSVEATPHSTLPVPSDARIPRGVVGDDWFGESGSRNQRRRSHTLGRGPPDSCRRLRTKRSATNASTRRYASTATRLRKWAMPSAFTTPPSAGPRRLWPPCGATREW